MALAGVALAAGLLYLSVMAGWMIALPMADDYSHRQRFDASGWRRDEGHGGEWSTRQMMATDLVRGRTLLGKTKAQILELLGPQTETAKFGEWGLVYWLGPEHGFIGIDSEWLVVRFASDGRADEVRLVTD